MENVITEHIEITPGVAGGKPRIAGHRITVQNIVIWHERMDINVDQIATEYGLELADIYAALTYYHDHRAEIDESIRSDETFVQNIRKRTPSKIEDKVSG